MDRLAEARMAGVRRRLNALPTVNIAHLPTALDDCSRVSLRLRGPMLAVKRDDCTGLALGGNKSRQLEYILGDAVASGADCIVQGADMQSNHARQLAAAGAKVGLDIHIAFEAPHGDAVPPRGNRLVTELMEPTIHWAVPSRSMSDVKREIAERLRDAGRRPYIVGRGARKSLVLGAVAYIGAYLEILEHCTLRYGKAPDWIYTSSQGSTQAGLIAGAGVMEEATEIVGINPVSPRDDGFLDAAAISRLAGAAAGALGLTLPSPPCVENTSDYIGPGFGIPSADGMQAVNVMAAEEGILLDNIYTGKAFAALLAQASAGRFGEDSLIVFLHTGGIPVMFA